MQRSDGYPKPLTEPDMTKTTFSRLDDHLNGLLIAAVVALVFFANFDAIQGVVADSVALASSPTATLVLALLA